MERFPNLDFLIPLALDAGSLVLRFRYCSQWDVRIGARPGMPAADAVTGFVIDRISDGFPGISVVTSGRTRIVSGSETCLFFGFLDDPSSFETLPTFTLASVSDGIPEAAVIYAPSGPRFWSARKGCGCRVDWRRVSVSERKGFDRSSFYAPERLLAEVGRPFSEGLRSLGASIVDRGPVAYMGGLIASGIFEGAVFPAEGKPEAPAIQLIVEEAGGTFSDFDGNGDIRYRHDRGMCPENEWYVASNGVLHDDFLYLIRSSRRS